MSVAIREFTSRKYCHLGKEREVFSAGEGPIVIVLHESPNPYPEVFDFGLRLVKSGYQVHLPVLFGKPNEPFRMGKALRHLSKICILKEFSVFAGQRSSPISDWIRAFCIDVQREKKKQGIGLIGMCLTGNFALSLLAEPWMLAPVLSQPSLPYAVTPRLSKGLHVDPETIEKAKQKKDLQVLGLRFTHDFLCPKSRFNKLRDTLGGSFQGIEINSGPFNGHSIPITAHSVLTKDFVNEHGHPTQEAFRKTVDFLDKKLKSHPT